jgi:cobaltochelatase CobT
MLTEGIQVMKYCRASAGRAGLSVVFEDVNQPRHDGRTIYLPRITYKTTDMELKQLMASVDHEVAHDKFSCFDVLKEKSADPKGLLMFVWNFLEDSRINIIEANEYQGFKENWDDCSSILVQDILSKAKVEKTTMSVLVEALLYWESRLSAYAFPQIELAASRVTPNKKISDVLSNYCDRLIDCHGIIDKRLGTESTFKLAEDILKELDAKCKDELPKPKASESKGKGKGKGTESSGKTGESSGEEPSKSDGDSSKMVDEEYKIIEVKVTEADLERYSLTIPEETGMGKTGINFKPVPSTRGTWDLTDFNKFIVVDYPKSKGDHRYLGGAEASARYFIDEYERRTEPKIISQENFAQQVRRLIQIRAKVQRVYGVKKGKLDQSRLSRICFNAPGFNERVFKNKIDNKTLDAAITVLVDKSGSMCGDKDQFALAATQMLNEVCSTLNIPVEIIGFSDDVVGTEALPLMYIYKNFSDHKVSYADLKKFYGMSSSHMHGNPDAENILWAHERLVQRKEKKKLLIVMSDGSPAATKGGSGIGRYTEEVIKEIEASKNVEIYGLGLCSDSVRDYYKSHSVVEEPQDIPAKLIELIERKILR